VDKTQTGGPVVGAVVNAVAILRHIGGRPEPSGVNAIARALSLSPSTCFNILKTLVREELVEFDPQTKTYSFAPGLAALVQGGAGRKDAFRLAGPALEILAERYASTVALWRLTASGRLVLLGLAESAIATRIHMNAGLRIPRLAGAGGRCIAANLGLPRELAAREFQKLRWQNAISFQSYWDQVAEARERGWALDDGDFLHGVTTVAAPILDRSGVAQYIVTATAFRGQHPSQALEKIGAELTRCATALARQIAT
jgi:DNA-binding IclR family transcriptional regulator